MQEKTETPRTRWGMHWDELLRRVSTYRMMTVVQLSEMIGAPLLPNDDEGGLASDIRHYRTGKLKIPFPVMAWLVEEFTIRFGEYIILPYSEMVSGSGFSYHHSAGDVENRGHPEREARERIFATLPKRVGLLDRVGPSEEERPEIGSSDYYNEPVRSIEEQVLEVKEQARETIDKHVALLRVAMYELNLLLGAAREDGIDVECHLTGEDLIRLEIRLNIGA